MFTGRAEADSGLLSEPVCRLWATGVSYCVLILCVHLWIYSLTGLRWFALCCLLVVRALRTGGPCRRTGQGRPSPGAARLRLGLPFDSRGAHCAAEPAVSSSPPEAIVSVSRCHPPRVAVTDSGVQGWSQVCVGSRWPAHLVAAVAVGDVLLEVWSRASALHPRWDSCQESLGCAVRGLLFPTFATSLIHLKFL